jgi:hypothetical protein
LLFPQPHLWKWSASREILLCIKAHVCQRAFYRCLSQKFCIL